VSRRLIGIIIAVVGLGVAVIGFFSIRQILTATLTPPATPAPDETATEMVLVTTRDFAIGDIVNENEVRFVEMPVELIPRNAIREVSDVIDRFAKVPLVSGEIILAHHLADPTNISHDIGFIMSNEMVLMAFPAGDLMSSLNVLQRGDLVDILVTLTETVEEVEGSADIEDAPPPDEPPPTDLEEPQSISRVLTFDAMQATDLSAIIADITYEEGSYGNVPLGSEEEALASSEPVPSSVRIKSYLLVVNPQDALLLKHLIDIGAKFDFVLRAPNNDQLFELQTVMSEYLIDRYQLEVPK
jgi:Flp pilus assembly protein CpaB